MVSVVTSLALSVAAALIVKELDGWGPRFASTAIGLAVKRLPPGKRERYREEWTGHVDQLPTSASKMFAAMGFVFAAIHMRIISRFNLNTGVIVQDAIMRGIDIFAGVASIFLFAPILTVIALAIKLSDGGQVLFVHQRIGRDGVPFKCYKFRTMARDQDGRTYVTKVGAFLRKSSLDELPQFFNLVNGSMSAVGPRPIIAEEQERYGDGIVHYKSVRPGITGLWQIDIRSDTTYSSKVILDVEFAQRRSLKLYIWVLLKTIPAVLVARGFHVGSKADRDC